MPSSVAEIVDKLKDRQQKEALSDLAFAKKLGVSRQMWNLIKLGKREPGDKVWSGIINAYPDLSGEILNIYTKRLFRHDNNGNDNTDSITLPTTLNK